MAHGIKQTYCIGLMVLQWTGPYGLQTLINQLSGGVCARVGPCVCVCVCVSCGNTPHHPLSLPGLTIHSQRIDILPMAEIDFWGCCRVRYGAWVVWFVCSVSNHESATRRWASEMRGKCSHLKKNECRESWLWLSTASQGLTVGVYIHHVHILVYIRWQARLNVSHVSGNLFLTS